MVRRVGSTLIMVSVTIVLGAIGVAARQATQPPVQAQPALPSGTGWQLPPEADDTKSPLTVDAGVLAAGKSLYKEKCERCHGPSGLGDGPDADPEAAADMDLTNPKRAARNSDGIVFYKVWNGRKKPKMPAQKDELTKNQIWAVVAHVQSLRKPVTK